MRRNKEMKFELDIQLFAEGEGGGDGAGSAIEETPPADGKEHEAGNGTKSLVEMMKENPAIQSEFDKLVGKALDTSKAKWLNDMATEKTEAEKLASMTKEEKAKYEQDKRMSELDAREQKLAVREMKAEAQTSLHSIGLPVEFSELLNYENAETVKASIGILEKAFNSAVKEKVATTIASNIIPDAGASTERSKSVEARLRKLNDL